jgi:methyl-accepting chemotaxis protein
MTKAFEEIAEAIQQTTTAMGQINVGARQQEQGISELVTSITEIDSASKESLASAEQTRKSILAIDGQIKRLDRTMATF